MQTSHLFKIWIIPNPNTHVLSNIIDTVEEKAKQYVNVSLGTSVPLLKIIGKK